MTTYPRKKLIREGDYAAEVDVMLIDDENGWGTCLSLKDVEKLDAVRKALGTGDLKTANQLAHVFELTPVKV